MTKTTKESSGTTRKNKQAGRYGRATIRQIYQSYFEEIKTTTGPRLIFSNNHVAEATTKVEYGWILGDHTLLGPKENNYGARKHDYEEIFIFFGNDPYDTSYRGGEGEFRPGEGDDTEKIMFNESCSVYVPANLGHFPCFFRNVKSPITMIVVVQTVGDLKPVSIPR